MNISKSLSSDRLCHLFRKAFALLDLVLQLAAVLEVIREHFGMELDNLQG